MRNVNEYAKFFLKKNLDDNPNTFDGNMKLQKLLFFANMISLAENNNLLFEEDMLAFEGGTVIEEVRKRYKNDHDGYIKDSIEFNPNFTDKEYEILNTTVEVFGGLPAKELSELNHTFDFWKVSLENSTNGVGYHDKSKAVIPIESLRKESYKIELLLNELMKNKNLNNKHEVINGIRFNYNPTEVNIDNILNVLEEFSYSADEESYSIYYDDNDMVIV